MSDHLLTPEEFGLHIRAGRTTVYGLIASGEVRSIKIGKLRRIPESEVGRFIAERLSAEPVGAARPSEPAANPA